MCQMGIFGSTLQWYYNGELNSQLAEYMEKFFSTYAKTEVKRHAADVYPEGHCRSESAMCLITDRDRRKCGEVSYRFERVRQPAFLPALFLKVTICKFNGRLLQNLPVSTFHWPNALKVSFTFKTLMFFSMADYGTIQSASRSLAPSS